MTTTTMQSDVGGVGVQSDVGVQLVYTSNTSNNTLNVHCLFCYIHTQWSEPVATLLKISVGNAPG